MRKLSIKGRHFSLLAATFSAILCTQQVNAQMVLSGTNYHQTFDSLSLGMPVGWSVDTGATATYQGYDVSNTFFYITPATNTGWGNPTGHFKNVASGTPYAFYANGGSSANQITQDNRALGVRQTGAMDSKAGFVFAIDNTVGLSNFALSFSLQSLDSTSGRTSTWKVDYALGNNPALFIPATTTGNMTTGGYRFSKDSIHVSFGNALNNYSGPVYIRIVSLNPTTGSGSRTTTAIDDYHLSWNGTAGVPSIAIKEKMPEGLNVPLTTNELQLKFSHPVEEGAGLIELFKSGDTIPLSIPVPSSSVVINDSTAIITGISLENNTSYYILMSAGSFKSLGDTLYNQAIPDTTFWAFSTVDTIPSTPPEDLRWLNEKFTNCIDIPLGNFTQYSMAGTAVWHCSTEGNGDSSAVSISGGIAGNSSEANEDWLISSSRFDLSGYEGSPFLTFSQKRKFEGSVSRSIKISTDYHSGLNPASATWVTIPETEWLPLSTTGEWAESGYIHLRSYWGTPFYLAFTYACGTDSAYELYYDNIVISGFAGISTPSKTRLDLQIIGEAESDKIVLGTDLLKEADLNIQMFDMMGRTVHQQQAKGKRGHQTHVINNGHFKSGMYVIRVWNGESYGTIKLMIK